MRIFALASFPTLSNKKYPTQNMKTENITLSKKPKKHNTHEKLICRLGVSSVFLFQSH